MMTRQGDQDHHIISDKHAMTKKHPWLKLEGCDLQSTQNKIFLPNMARSTVDLRRSIHDGGHARIVNRKLAEKMTIARDIGQAKKWTQEQYRKAVDKIIADERLLLKSAQGN